MAKEDVEKKDEVAPGFPPPGAVEPGEDGPDYPPGPHPSFLKPDYEFRNTLEPEQRTKFDELHALLFEKREGEPLTAAQRAFCDDRCLRRYLTARDWNVDKAHALLLATLEWRITYDVAGITAAGVECEAAWGRMYRRGFDKLGRPVFVARPVGTTSEDWALQTRYVVYNFEHAIASMAPGVEQVVWIIDYTQFSLTAAPPMAFSRGVLTTMSDHYPERMGAIFAINPPMMFRVLWGALSPFIPAKSKNKIYFVTGKEEAKKALMHEHVDPEVLEADLLGQGPKGYDHAAYWPRSAAHDVTRFENLAERTTAAMEALGITETGHAAGPDAASAETAPPADGSGTVEENASAADAPKTDDADAPNASSS